jgi:hypothetical protein
MSPKRFYNKALYEVGKQIKIKSVAIEDGQFVM